METGAYKPFRTPAKKGEVVKGELWCTTGVWRARPDGSDVELLAWGICNPFGMANGFVAPSEQAVRCARTSQTWLAPPVGAPRRSFGR